MPLRIRSVAVVLVAASVFSLSGCASMTPRDRDTAIGAAVGGVVGSVLLGGTLGTIGGAVAGGVIGNRSHGK